MNNADLDVHKLKLVHFHTHTSGRTIEEAKMKQTIDGDGWRKNEVLLFVKKKNLYGYNIPSFFQMVRNLRILFVYLKDSVWF